VLSLIATLSLVSSTKSKLLSISRDSPIAGDAFFADFAGAKADFSLLETFRGREDGLGRSCSELMELATSGEGRLMLERLLDTRPLLRRGLTRIPGELRSTIVGGSEF